MGVKKKQYDAGLKAKLALELIAEKKSILEICSENNVPQANLYGWRDKLVNEAKNLFIPHHEGNKKIKLLEKEVAKLHKLIGEITVENNFLKKKLED
jgi:transposase